ncbi:MAG TPA: tripartite tricarboxylate transporter substrate binding protein [Ramlibacter sp.]|nr:tripartite tricarboxylate transporter substrate binding protein [Ramlibacter sp.]
MTISRRACLQLAAAWAAMATASAKAQQQYPAKPVRLIVPATPGATIDANARYIAEQLGARWKTGVLADNRAGAGGGIGSDMVAKAAPDGYTLLFAGTTHFTTRLLPDSALTYDPVKDFTAVAKVSSAALALVVPADSPYRSLGDLVRAMKAKPGDIAYGTGGKGSTSHLCTVLLNDLTQTKAKHVAYKGNTQAVTDTIGGQVAFTCQGSGGVLPLIKAGRLRALAVSSRARWDSLPEVPTGQEAGVAGFEISSWMGLMGPARMPAPLVQSLSDEVLRIARSAEYKEFADKQGMVVDIADHRTFQAELPREEQKWRRLVTLANAD